MSDQRVHAHDLGRMRDPSARANPRWLTLEDIADARAYERERDAFRRHVIELKRRRRVPVGPIVTFVFECRDTVRFQIQEMVRAERILSDEGVQGELDVYNPLIPAPGELSATLFIELTDEAALREWLPRLVGIERAARLRIRQPNGAVAEVPGVPEEAHEQTLTREDVTASVHYLRFEVGDPEAFASGEVELAVEHPAYQARAVLSEETKRELLADLRP
jgi:hypothetical protein